MDTDKNHLGRPELVEASCPDADTKLSVAAIRMLMAWTPHRSLVMTKPYVGAPGDYPELAQEVRDVARQHKVRCEKSFLEEIKNLAIYANYPMCRDVEAKRPVSNPTLCHVDLRHFVAAPPDAKQEDRSPLPEQSASHSRKKETDG
ncbi:hypothetical protein GR268_38565 [Rhizobium leguminosarum]|nr:hypothetical protein [Rhizobium leguminosarum]